LLLRGASLVLALLFAVRATVDVYRRWGSGHYVALLPEGMLHQAIRPIFVPWSAVDTAGVFEWQRSKGTGVRLRQSGEVQAPWWVRRNMPSNRRLYGFELILVEFEAAREELAEAIQNQFLASVGREYGSTPTGTASQPSG
jgi:hypothetical protein